MARKYYNHASMAGDKCYYCGAYGDEQDHYPAVSIEALLPGDKGLLVRACSFCNQALSNSHQPTLEDRKKEALRLGEIKYDLWPNARPAFATREEKYRYIRMEQTMLYIIGKAPRPLNADAILQELEDEKHGKT